MIKLNGEKLKITNFPNSESLISFAEFEPKTLTGNNVITFKYENDSDLIHLMFVKKFLDGISENTILNIPYFPYSRMDRTENLSTVFTLKYLCSFINDLKFKSVIISEPHSDVVTALLDNVYVRNTTKVIAEKLMNELEYDKKDDCLDFILYPDAGAQKRYSKQISYDKYITCNKIRNFETGYITSMETQFHLPQHTSTKDKKIRVIIVDDLCSKGTTFLKAAENVKQGYPNAEIYLVVTHCENAIFKGELLKTDFIKEIHTTDSIITDSHEKIIIEEIDDNE